MKLLAKTDVHGRTQVLKWVIELSKDFDLLVIAGDVMEWGDERFFRNFYKSLSGDTIETLFVLGNHDPILELTRDKISNLHGRSINFGGLIFCGIGGSNPTPLNTPFELDDDRA
jgi:Icc-related predicted phosphoesterase